MHEHLLLALNAPAQLPLCTRTLLPASTTVGPLFLHVLPPPPGPAAAAAPLPAVSAGAPPSGTCCLRVVLCPTWPQCRPPRWVMLVDVRTMHSTPTVVAVRLATCCHMRKVAKQVVRTDGVVTPAAVHESRFVTLHMHSACRQPVSTTRLQTACLCVAGWAQHTRLLCLCLLAPCLQVPGVLPSVPAIAGLPALGGLGAAGFGAALGAAGIDPLGMAAAGMAAVGGLGGLGALSAASECCCVCCGRGKQAGRGPWAVVLLPNLLGVHSRPAHAPPPGVLLPWPKAHDTHGTWISCCL